MSDTSSSPTEFTEFSRNQVWAALISLATFVAGMAGAGFFLKTEIQMLATWITEQFGIGGLMLLTFLGDSFPSPFPPDIALLVVAKGPLRENWPLHLGLVVTASFFAGHLAYLWGALLSRQKWLPGYMQSWPQKHEALIKAWGKRVVIIGALTPFPFSLSCMSAGFVKLNYRDFTIATFYRIPRILIFYFAIHFL